MVFIENDEEILRNTVGLAHENNGLCSMGSEEDEVNDSAPKFAKLRPMRVEIFLYVHLQIHAMF